MKLLLLPSAILVSSFAYPSHAQESTETKPALTEAQVSSVLNQLKELETQISQMRGNTLASVMTKLREGMTSDQAAMKLFMECDMIVNSERKESDKADARKRQEQIEKNMERRGKGGGNNDEGDVDFAIRLGIQYLVLTLEANEAKEEEFKKIVPKLQEYIQTLLAAAPKLKGRANGQLASALTDRNPIVSAFNLTPYINPKNWANRPTDIGGMYMQTIFPIAAKDDMASLPTLWDARINAEGTFRKEHMFVPEFELWTKTELPGLRWQRAKYLYEKGPSAINAMADMLKLIKENPGHSDAPKWVKELRQLVNQSAPSPASPNLEASAGS